MTGLIDRWLLGLNALHHCHRYMATPWVATSAVTLRDHANIQQSESTFQNEIEGLVHNSLLPLAAHKPAPRDQKARIVSTKSQGLTGN
jgi:hypothetical protein